MSVSLKKKYRLAFLGCGHMGEAILKGLLLAEHFGREQMAVYDPARAEALKAQYGVEGLTGPERLHTAEMVLVAVKPQTVPEIIGRLAKTVSGETLVISVAAGLSLDYWESRLAPSTPVVRAMPNLPALIGRGFTAFCRGRQANDEQMKAARAIFATVGETVEAPESALHALTAISGCGPAYVFYFLEALVEAGIMLGLSAELAQQAALETLAGSAALAQAELKQPTREGLAGLKRLVSSPGGVTARALYVLEQKAVKGAIMAALEAADQKSRRLAEGK